MGASECTTSDNQKLTATFLDPFIPSPNDPITRYMVWSVNATIWGRFNCDNETDGANLFLLLGEAVIGFTSNGTDTPSAYGCGCPACAVPFQLQSAPGVVDDLSGTASFLLSRTIGDWFNS